MSQCAKRGMFATLAILFFTSVAIVSLTSGTRLIVHADPAGIKYTGAGTCSAAACHGAAAPKEEAATRHNENTTWSGDKDKHSVSYSDPKRGLVSPEAKEIAGKLKLADATKADRCLTCHALSGIGADRASRVFLKPGDINAAKYKVDEGNSCDACHGPADTYVKDHVAAGWTAKQRTALGSEKLYTQVGLYDTKNLKFRANQCLSCHLKIDADMVAAGHPELSFELDSMTNPDQPWNNDWIHWRKNPAWYSGKVWAMGQVVSLRHAALQLSERHKAKAADELIKKSQGVVIAHALTSRQIAKVVDAGSQAAIDAQLTAINAAGADGAKVAAAADELAKAADALADKVNDKAWDQAATDTLLKGVASEGAQATASGFKAAEQFSIGLNSLYNTIVNNSTPKPADADAKNAKIGDLYTPLGDGAKDPFKADDFGKAAAGMATQFPGGASIPLPK